MPSTFGDSRSVLTNIADRAGSQCVRVVHSRLVAVHSMEPISEKAWQERIVNFDSVRDELSNLPQST